MEFRIADTFTVSLRRLTAQEKKVLKTTDLNCSRSGLHRGYHFINLIAPRTGNF